MEDAWLRACATCGDPFVVDRACGFNRRYCGEACATVGRAASVGKAQKTYRDKPAVRERHRAQERTRRARMAERVRDHIQQPACRHVTVESMSAPKAVAAAPAALPMVTPAAPAARLAPLGPAAPPAVRSAGPAAVAPTGSATVTACSGVAEWRLIVGHALAAHAETWRRRGTIVRCACCGRPGRVVAVVVRAELEWRREAAEDGA